MTADQTSHRKGFSLLELLLSLAILGGALAALAANARTGIDAAIEARVLSMARILAQAKMNEMLLNITLGQTPTPITASQAEPFDSKVDVDFLYSVEVQQNEILQGLLNIQVYVEAQNPNDSEQPYAKYTLTRWVVDPAVGLEIAEEEEELAKEEARGETDAI